MLRIVRLLFVSMFMVVAAPLFAQTQVASLHPNDQLVWQRTSPPDGPVLYQIIFRSSATPQHVPVISPQFTLQDSHIIDSGSALTFSELVSFAGGQTFPGTVKAVHAGTGVTVNTAAGVATVGLANGGVTLTQIDSGAANNGQVLTANGSGGATWKAIPATSWSLTGNAGTGCSTTPCTEFLGTVDNDPFELRVDNIRALRIEPAVDGQESLGFSPNIIAGNSTNQVFAGNATGGATIAGGANNEVAGSFGTVSGGLDNQVFSVFGTVCGGLGNVSLNEGSTVAGGENNTADGVLSFAAGDLANTNGHTGAFVWGDASTQGKAFDLVGDLFATADNQFIARAVGGFEFVTGITNALAINPFQPDPAKTIVFEGNSGKADMQDVVVDSANKNSGQALEPGALTFGAGSGEGIASQRDNEGGNEFGLDFYTDFIQRMHIRQDGLVKIDGNLQVVGQIFAGTKDFKIDDPLDPANKYLVHASVESPDMMDIYNGNVVTDAQGRATVVLPRWFEALNKDFRYQLTVIGQFAQAIVSREIHGNLFSIRTNRGGVKVSWQVTGIRHDAYADANRFQPEEDKGKQRGTYLHPELYGAAGGSQAAQ